MMPVNKIVCPRCRQAGEEKPRKILLFIRVFRNRSFSAPVGRRESRSAATEASAVAARAAASR
jgi:hypothetical protein